MSTREYVYNLIDGLNEAQLKALADFITNFAPIKEDKTKEYKLGEIYFCENCKGVRGYNFCMTCSNKIIDGTMSVLFLTYNRIRGVEYYTLQGNYNNKIVDGIHIDLNPETIPVARIKNYVATLTDLDMTNLNKKIKEYLGLE